MISSNIPRPTKAALLAAVASVAVCLTSLPGCAGAAPDETADDSAEEQLCSPQLNLQVTGDTVAARGLSADGSRVLLSGQMVVALNKEPYGGSNRAAGMRFVSLVAGFGGGGSGTVLDRLTGAMTRDPDGVLLLRSKNGQPGAANFQSYPDNIKSARAFLNSVPAWTALTLQNAAASKNQLTGLAEQSVDQNGYRITFANLGDDQMVLELSGAHDDTRIWYGPFTRPPEKPNGSSHVCKFTPYLKSATFARHANVVVARIGEKGDASGCAAADVVAAYTLDHPIAPATSK